MNATAHRLVVNPPGNCPGVGAMAQTARSVGNGRNIANKPKGREGPRNPGNLIARRIFESNHPLPPAHSIKFAISLVVIASSSMAAHTLAATIQAIPPITQVAALNGDNNGISTSSPATVTITGTGDPARDSQSQANADTLTSRDAGTANQSLRNTLTLQDTARLQAQQRAAQQNQQAAQMVGAVLDHVIGDLAAQNGWAEGSTQKVLLHGLSGAIQAGIAGGSLAAGIAAGAVNEKLIPLMTDYLRGQGVSEFVQDAQGNTVLNPQFAELLKIGSTLVGAAAGAVAGSGASSGASNVALGASVGLTGTTYNRLLHPSERMLAAELAQKSGGKYTAEQIENALRNSGNSALGESIISGMVVSANDPNGVYDPGAQFNAGEDGKTAVQKLPDGGQVNPALAAFITANTGGNASPYGWQDVQLGRVAPMVASPNYNTITPASNGCVTGECAAGVASVKNPVRDMNDVRNDVADGASVVSRGSGIVGSAATAAATVPGPHQPGAATTAVVATGVGFAADVVEQMARPDAKKFFVEQMLLGIPAYVLAERYPVFAPVINEAQEQLKRFPK